MTDSKREVAEQCDGCMAGMPVVEGIHRNNGRAHMACTASRYAACGLAAAAPGTREDGVSSTGAQGDETDIAQRLEAGIGDAAKCCGFDVRREGAAAIRFLREELSAARGANAILADSLKEWAEKVSAKDAELATLRAQLAEREAQLAYHRETNSRLLDGTAELRQQLAASEARVRELERLLVRAQGSVRNEALAAIGELHKGLLLAFLAEIDAALSQSSGGEGV